MIGMSTRFPAIQPDVSQDTIIAELRRRIIALEDELDLARTDPITHLPTRGYWSRLATTQYRTAGAVILADVDGLKTVNDTHGHPVGDQVLSAVARRVDQGLPSGSVLGRIGGDEFAAVTRCAPTAGDLDRLIAAAAVPILTLDRVEVRVGLSVGMALPPQVPGGSLTAALGSADMAMYDAKGHGGGWCLYSPPRHGMPAGIDRPTSRARNRDRDAA